MWKSNWCYWFLARHWGFHEWLGWLIYTNNICILVYIYHSWYICIYIHRNMCTCTVIIRLMFWPTSRKPVFSWYYCPLYVHIYQCDVLDLHVGMVFPKIKNLTARKFRVFRKPRMGCLFHELKRKKLSVWKIVGIISTLNTQLEKKPVWGQSIL